MDTSQSEGCWPVHVGILAAGQLCLYYHVIRTVTEVSRRCYGSLEKAQATTWS